LRPFRSPADRFAGFQATALCGIIIVCPSTYRFLVIMDDAATPEFCPTCTKPTRLCVCEAIAPLRVPFRVVLLQHPQEKRELLGTAVLAHLQIADSILRVGLSWANLHKIVGEDVDPHRWGVLYLGPTRPGGARSLPPISVVDKKGEPLEESPYLLRDIDGIIVLDGTWSQAKTLWWRNAWLLKCRRIVINPDVRSLYGAARKEPRKDSLSTLEAVAFTLAKLTGKAEVYDRLLEPFALLLKKHRAPRPRPTPIAPAPNDETPDEV